MLLSKIRKLIKLFEESNIGELEVSSWGRKITIRKKVRGYSYDKNLNQCNYSQTNPTLSGQYASNPKTPSHLETTIKNKEKLDLIEIKSSMVGTFYRSPSPENPEPYVKIGQKIKEKQIIYRIEAMGLVHEIESDYSGIIIERLVGDEKDGGVSVQFGQPLFLIDPSNGEH